MKTNYDELENEELDNLAAEMMGWRLHDNNIWVEGTQAIVKFYKDKWHPTHPDSNQCERYLFPKLESMCPNKSITIQENRAGGMYSITIKKLSSPMISVYFDIDSLDPDQINRTKVLAFLKVMEEIG